MACHPHGLKFTYIGICNVLSLYYYIELGQILNLPAHITCRMILKGMGYQWILMKINKQGQYLLSLYKLQINSVEFTHV